MKIFFRCADPTTEGDNLASYPARQCCTESKSPRYKALSVELVHGFEVFLIRCKKDAICWHEVIGSIPASHSVSVVFQYGVMQHNSLLSITLHMKQPYM